MSVNTLEAELRSELRGEVRFDRESRALYATDGSNYRQVPIGVVLPRDTDDVIHTVAAARRHGVPLLSRGGGTSLAGQCCNVALVMDFSKYMHRILELDSDKRLARVEPGCVLDDLRHAAEGYHLTFGPDPATHTHCTLGGMLGNNSCGIHSHLSANEALGLRTSDNTEELAILTYDGVGMRVGATSPEELEAIIHSGGRRGQIYAELKALRDRYADEIRHRFPRLPRRVSGYNLDELLPENNFNVARALVGTESTCVTILEATVHLIPYPPARSLLVLGYPDICDAADQVMNILEHGPTALEGFDRLLFEWIRQKGDRDADLALLPPGGGWLLVEFSEDTQAEADGRARELMAALRKGRDPPAMRICDDPRDAEKIWKVREGGLGSTAWVPGRPDTWEGWEDAAVPPARIGGYLRDFGKLLARYDYTTSLYGHLGQGCIHCRIPFDLYTADGIRRYRSFIADAAELVLRHGGSLSGEHGDGQSRAELLPRMFGDRLVQAFREFKGIWDPAGRMNPGKVVEPYSITDNLRLGVKYEPPELHTRFGYPQDQFDFSRAVLRCVGVGACRREVGGTMCPSYMVTREEQHSTRGRARLLWEMLNGSLAPEGWRSDTVREALDLCLACKGCRAECPVNVDMATYKAEFLANHYAGRLRPRQAYAFGWVHQWLRLASLAPGMANAATQSPRVSRAVKWVANVAPARRLPLLAPWSFKAWFNQRPRPSGDLSPVVLWLDTFNSYFHPETARAAVEVLEAAGFQVEIPSGDLCCGRPLYDYGFLGTARRWLRRILAALRSRVRAGVPVVVLEPSCAAVFRDELINLLPNDQDARRLHDQVFLLAEFLQRWAPDAALPSLRRRAIVHGHCHQKAIMGMNADRALLTRLGLEIRIPDTGCCGMAGAFGFERGDHYDVSVACGERALFPEVRRADEATLILADGFSCRQQIAQGTGRRAMHLAEVIHLAMGKGPKDSLGDEVR
jgi:FAD/FMN-containing dehydrogenase/Fe-S oxidoreductase